MRILKEKTLQTWLVELGGVSLGILNSDVNFWAQILFSLFTIFIKKIKVQLVAAADLIIFGTKPFDF